VRRPIPIKLGELIHTTAFLHINIRPYPTRSKLQLLCIRIKFYALVYRLVSRERRRHSLLV